MSEQPKWTPGPWKPHANGTVAWVRQEPEGRTTTFVGQTFGMAGRPQKEAEANQHLIAAAPDLYAALDAIIDGRMWSMSDNKFGAAKAALRKARGEA